MGRPSGFDMRSRDRDSSGNPFYKGLAKGKKGQGFVKRLQRIARSGKLQGIRKGNFPELP